jgi:iron complex outermembrane receptor protein
LAPAWAFFAGLSYSHPIVPGISAFVNGELALKSGYYGYVDDSVYSHVSSKAVENLQLGLTVDRVDVALWVKNISDERLFAPVFPTATGAGGYMANPGEPRTFGLTVRYNVE